MALLSRHDSRAWPAVALLLSLLASGASARPEGDLTREEARLVAMLRDSRSPQAPPLEEILPHLAAAGQAALGRVVTILDERRLPPLEPEESTQTLSVPQREMLLAAVAQMEEMVVRRELQRLQRAARAGAEVPDPSVALWLLGASAEADQLDTALELAQPADEEALHLSKRMAEALRWCVAQVLLRDGSGYDVLLRRCAGLHVALLPPLLHAVGDTRHPAGMGFLIEVLDWRPELYPLVIGRLHHLGPSWFPAENARMANLIRCGLDPDRPNASQEALRALAVLGDDEAVPTMLDWLESPQRGTRDAAHWALRHMSRLRSPADGALWRRWYESEMRARQLRRPTLRAALLSSDAARQVGALKEIAVRRLHRDEWVELLLECRPATPAVEVLLCQTLGELRSPAGIGALLERLERSSPHLRGAAATALAQITGESLGDDPLTWRQRLLL